MQYAGQSNGEILPLTEREKARPDLIFTEHDRRVYYKAIQSAPLVGLEDIFSSEIQIPNLSVYHRWHEQATVGESHQAAYLLQKYYEAYRSTAQAILEQAGLAIEPLETLE